MDFTPRLTPYKHQIEAEEKDGGREAFAYLMGMRTGKTKVTLDVWAKMVAAGDVRDLLVVAPGGVYRTWEGALDDHLGPELRAATELFTWKSGPNSAQRRELEGFLRITDRKRPRVMLVNVEALSTVKMARDAAAAFLPSRGASFAVDESTAIKNPTAKRTRYINEQLAPLARRRRILSGLPTPKSPLDIYSQFEFLDPRLLGFRSYVGFRARYAVLQSMPFGGVSINAATGEESRRKIPIVVNYKNEEELRDRIQPHSYRKRLEDCYDVPPRVYMRREVQLTMEQERAYTELKEYCTTMLASGVHVTATIVITQILKLHQLLCGHARDEQGNIHDVPENRTRELLDVLQEYDGKAVVWCSYDRDIQRVSSILEKEFGRGCTARFWGGNRATREQEEVRFKCDPSCYYMVATAAAGGRGRTWDVADLLVYYSSANDLEHRSQSEERGSGIGKTRPMTVVDLVAPGTVDERILHALRRKIDMAATITGDNWREWVV